MKAVKRAIILCWIMLIVCFIIKLFGGNWFEIICNNEHFIYVCNFIDTHLIVNYCIALPIYIIPTFFLMLACCICPKPNIKQVIIILISLLVVWTVQFIHPYAKLISEIIAFILLPFCVRTFGKEKTNWKNTLKKTWYLGIIGYGLDLIFQILSLITKNIGIKLIEENSLISLLFMVDYYIMIALYYLYILLKHKKEKQKWEDGEQSF